MSRPFIGALCATVAAALVASPAAAHITLEKPEASPRAAVKLVFRVTHGCDGAATTSVAVTMPEGIIAAKPMPKPGWTVDIAKGAYAKAYAFYHGTTLAKGATAITWKGGSLSDDMYDEFVVAAFVSDAFESGSIVAFPVTQTCDGSKHLDWVEVPRPGQDAHALKTPAPLLKILGAAAEPAHHH